MFNSAIKEGEVSERGNNKERVVGKIHNFSTIRVNHQLREKKKDPKMLCYFNIFFQTVASPNIFQFIISVEPHHLSASLIRK